MAQEEPFFLIFRQETPEITRAWVRLHLLGAHHPGRRGRKSTATAAGPACPGAAGEPVWRPRRPSTRSDACRLGPPSFDASKIAGASASSADIGSAADERGEVRKGST